jgi:Ca2+-binding EF-hand superfamily protein
MPIHLKSNFIGVSTSRTPAPPSPTQSALSGCGRGTSPQRRARYRNQNGVWVHYNKPAIKQKQVVEDDSDGKNTEMEARTKSSVERILDNLLLAISSDRSLYGHQLNSVEDAFMAFDKEGTGSLGIPELQDALKRLGVMATRPQVKKLINMIDIDQSGRVEYSEFATCLEERRKIQEELSRVLRQGAKGTTHSKLGNNGGSSKSGTVTNSTMVIKKTPGISKKKKTTHGVRQKAKQKNLTKAAAEKKRRQRIGVQKLGKMDPELLERATLAFNSADASHDGSISFPEFFQKLHGCRPSVDDAERVRKCRELFKFWDRDNSGGIDLLEFHSVLLSPTSTQQMKHALRVH